MNYDEAYKKTPDLFGPEPEALLRKFVREMDKSRPVLDIGAGQGRNALFLAREGFAVHAIDPSKAAVESIAAAAAKENLPIRTKRCGFETFVPGTSIPGTAAYSGVLLFGLVQILTLKSIGLLVGKASDWTGPGGLVFVTAFTTADPAFKEGRGGMKTYLEPGEILELFAGLAAEIAGGFEVVHHWEGPGPEHRHGDAPPERHARAEAVFKKIKEE